MAFSLASLFAGATSAVSSVISGATQFVAQVARGAGNVLSGQVTIPQYLSNVANVVQAPWKQTATMYSATGPYQYTFSPAQRAALAAVDIAGAVAAGGLVATGATKVLDIGRSSGIPQRAADIVKSDYIQQRASDLIDRQVNAQPSNLRIEDTSILGSDVEDEDVLDISELEEED